MLQRTFFPSPPSISWALCTPRIPSNSGYKPSTVSSCNFAARIFSFVHGQCILTKLSWMPLKWKADWKNNLRPESHKSVDTLGGKFCESSFALITFSRNRRSSAKVSPSITPSLFHPGISAMNQGWCIMAGSGARDIQSQSITL